MPVPRCSLSHLRHEQSDYTSVQRRIQSFSPTNDNPTSATLATSQPKQEFSDNPVGAVNPAAIGREAAAEGVSPVGVQSQVTADRFLSPIALIPADDQRLGPQASSNRFRCSDKGFLSLSQGDSNYFRVPRVTAPQEVSSQSQADVSGSILPHGRSY